MVEKYYVSVVGNLAMMLGIISFLPVMYTIFKTKKANNFPYKSLILLLTSNILWVIYGYFVSANATIISGSFFTLIYFFILYIKSTN